MWLVIILFVALLICFKMLYNNSNDDVKEKQYDDNYIASHMGRYYGGFDISAKDYNLLEVFFYNDKTIFLCKKTKTIYKKVEINNSDIVSVRFMDEITIKENVSLGKMICFGVLSFAMKNEKKKITEYVVADIKYKDKITSVILDGDFALSNNTALFEKFNNVIIKN